MPLYTYLCCQKCQPIMGWEFKLKDDIKMKTFRYTWLVATLLVVGLLASCSPKGAKKLLETIPQESLLQRGRFDQKGEL